MERTATAWLALEVGGGAFAVGLVFAARMLPSLLFGLAAGTIADRSDRPRQLLAVAAAALPLMAVLSWLAGAGALQAWHVVAISFLAGCLQVFDTPARQALILDTAPREVAANAVALSALGTRLVMALGALASGFLIPAFGPATCYLFVAALYGIGGILVATLRVPSPHRAEIVRPSFGRALRDAARLVVDVPAIRTLSIAGIVCEVFAFSHMTALPVLARDVFAAGPEGLGALNSASSIGATVSVLLLSLLPGRTRREPVMGAVFVLYGAAILALSLAGELVVAAAAMLVIGACAGAFDVLQQTLIQMAAPEDQRGRAVGIWVLGLGSAPFGHIEMGATVAALGAPGALLINGSLVLLSAATLLVRAPTYRWALRPRPS
jgi:predicted MFS family arabinose efflux permease